MAAVRRISPTTRFVLKSCHWLFFSFNNKKYGVRRIGVNVPYDKNFIRAIAIYQNAYPFLSF
jgi:hypothetical protein